MLRTQLEKRINSPLTSSAGRLFDAVAALAGIRQQVNYEAQAAIEFDEAQATLSFDAGVTIGSKEDTFVAGTQGSLYSTGPGNQSQSLTVTLADGAWSPVLKGKWFSDGFHGTMGELLSSIEEDRPCTISAEDNLQSLALCFAALASAETAAAVVPGSVRRLPN